MYYNQEQRQKLIEAMTKEQRYTFDLLDTNLNKVIEEVRTQKNDLLTLVQNQFQDIANSIEGIDQEKLADISIKIGGLSQNSIYVEIKDKDEPYPSEIKIYRYASEGFIVKKGNEYLEINHSSSRSQSGEKRSLEYVVWSHVYAELSKSLYLEGGIFKVLLNAFHKLEDIEKELNNALSPVDNMLKEVENGLKQKRTKEIDELIDPLIKDGTIIRIETPSEKKAYPTYDIQYFNIRKVNKKTMAYTNHEGSTGNGLVRFVEDKERGNIKDVVTLIKSFVKDNSKVTSMSSEEFKLERESLKARPSATFS